MNAAQTIRRWRPLLWALTALALVAVVAWKASGWNPSSVNAGTVSPTRNNGQGLDSKPGLDLYPRTQRVPAPAFRGSTLDGEQFTLSQLTRKVVVINVWGSWCAPCRAEIPELVRVANQYADRGVRFVGIDTRDNTTAAQAFVRTFKVPYPSVEDPQGQVLLALKDVVPISVVPTTVVVDRHGMIAARIIGPVSYTTLKGILGDELAAEGGGR